MTHWQELIALFGRHGHLEYAGEAVSQWQHAWQCGQLARRAQVAPELQLAAWLHDIGHLLDGVVATPTLQGIDDRHEVRAAALLEPWFGAAVVSPIALHVQAKRYLVAVQPSYADGLSADSRRSLALQGGPMAPREQAHWRQQPHADDALRLRAWDDLAKDVDWWPVNREQARADLVALMARCALKP